ncbi:unnamed protein product, partial [Didymodactylos carnosus]
SLLLLLLLIYKYFTSSNYNKDHERIPGLRPQLLFGNLLQTNVLKGEAFVNVWSQFQKQYGDIFTYYFGNERAIVFSKAEHAQYIYHNRHIYDMCELFAKYFQLTTPNGLICINGEKYKRHARVVLPALKRNKVTPQLETIVKCTDKLIANWKRDNDYNSKLVKNIISQSQQLLINIILFIGFDADYLSDQELERLANAANTFIQYSAFAISSGMPKTICHYYLKFDRKYHQARHTLKEYADQIIKKEGERYSNTQPMTTNKKLISLLISSADETTEHGLTKEELLDEILLFIEAGFEWDR